MKNVATLWTLSILIGCGQIQIQNDQPVHCICVPEVAVCQVGDASIQASATNTILVESDGGWVAQMWKCPPKSPCIVVQVDAEPLLGNCQP